MLRSKSKESYTPPGYIDFEIENGETVLGSWRDSFSHNLQPIHNDIPHRPNITAEKIRKTFMEHFNGPGQVPWQWKVLYE